MTAKPRENEKKNKSLASKKKKLAMFWCWWRSKRRWISCISHVQKSITDTRIHTTHSHTHLQAFIYHVRWIDSCMTSNKTFWRSLKTRAFLFGKISLSETNHCRKWCKHGLLMINWCASWEIKIVSELRAHSTTSIWFPCNIWWRCE